MTRDEAAAYCEKAMLLAKTYNGDEMPALVIGLFYLEEGQDPDQPTLMLRTTIGDAADRAIAADYLHHAMVSATGLVDRLPAES